MLETSRLAGECLFFPTKSSAFDLLANIFGDIGCSVLKARFDFLRTCSLSSVTV